MEIVKSDTNIDFIGWTRAAVILSLVVVVAGIVSLIVKGGPEYGIDFAGGTLIQVRFSTPVATADIRDALRNIGLGSFSVQQFGTEADEFLIRARETTGHLQQFSQRVKETLERKFGDGKLDIRRAEMVGPQVGKDLQRKGAMALLYAIIGMLIYISWRFEFRFAVGAVVALTHDVLVTLGFFSILGREIDLTSIAAFLTIIGYSLNDTIVIYDRIRENRAICPNENFSSVVNRSINETLSRTLLTSGTTLLVVGALFFLGGVIINNFAFALMVGIIAGTYSSIFVAGALVLFWEKWRPAPIKEKPPA
ncbi:MAG: protein translocase subunit SecF [Deltaproteobacteria bacterium]|nr:protein translocase subunit SecF [Deltaproteobacteria bacterium]